MQNVDFFVIGAGSGGVRAARIAALHGAKTVVAEEFRPGGTCVIRGCVPKKLYVYASRFADDFRDAAGFGWTVGETRFDWARLVAAKEKEISRLSDGYVGALASAGAGLERQRATIVGPNDVVLADGARFRAKHILVATGGRPTLSPDIPGINLAKTSNEIFDLPHFPKRLLIVGGGYIAVEFASIFQRLGAEVTMVLRGDALLRGFDEDLRARLGASLLRAGVAINFGTLPTRIERDGRTLRVTLSKGGSLDADEILVATGREPNTAGLGLESVGVTLNAAGGVIVDANFDSSVASIHAVGDVSSRKQLTPVAIREGHVLADRLFSPTRRTVRTDMIPTAVFTTPEIGTVGMSEAEALNAYGALDIFQAEFRAMRATLGGGGDKVFLKLVVESAGNRVVGAHLFGEGAAEIAQTLAVAMGMGATKADLDATMALHPSVAEELVTMRTPFAKRVAQRENADARAH